MTSRTFAALCFIGVTLPILPQAASPQFEIPLFPSTADTYGRQGFFRLVNWSGQAGPVTVEAIDEAGQSFGRFSVRLEANQNLHFNSNDLEDEVGGPGRGHWRLRIQSDSLDHIMPLAYIRSPDGFLSPMNGSIVSRERETDFQVYLSTVNPASNWSKVSHLRIINAGEQPNRLAVYGEDDQGSRVETPYVYELGAGEIHTLTAVDLEREWEKNGQGKWEVWVISEFPVRVVNLMESTQTGHLVNMSVHRVDVAENVGNQQSAPESEIAFFRLVQGKKLCLGSCDLNDHTFYFNGEDVGSDSVAFPSFTHFGPAASQNGDFWRYEHVESDQGVLTLEYGPLGVSGHCEASLPTG